MPDKSSQPEHRAIRCAALDIRGKHCPARRNLAWVQYHGESELYDHFGPEPTWMKVLLCPKHRTKK